MEGQDLGLAVLRLTVDARDAETQLNAFRSLVNRQLSGVGDRAFDGVSQQARSAGEAAGKTLADGIKKGVESAGRLRFANLDEALTFGTNLKSTLGDLRAYRQALIALQSQLDATSEAYLQLQRALNATNAAIKTVETAGAATGLQTLGTAFQRVSDTARLLQFERQITGLRTLTTVLNEGARAAVNTAKALGTISTKGIGEALRLPNAPKVGDNSGLQNIIQLVERLKKQAETASGKTARLTEGISVLGAGGFAAKGIVDTLGGVSGTADKVASALLSVQERLNALPGALRGLGGIDDIFGAAGKSIQQWAASILQAQGDLASLTAPLQAVTDALGALGPEAAAVGGALAFSFAGFQDLIAKSFKPGIEDARKALRGITDDTQALLEALARASSATSDVSLTDLVTARRDAVSRQAGTPVGSDINVEATEELLKLDEQIRAEKSKQFYLEQSLLRTSQQRLEIAEALKRAANSPNNPQLALPSSELLNAEGRGITRLSTTGINDIALDAGIAKGREFTQQLLAAAGAGGQLPPIFRQVLSSLESLASITNEQTVGLRAQNELLQDQLSLTQQLEGRRSQQARQRLAQQAQERQQTKADLLAQEAESRKQERIASERLRNQRQQRIGGAIGSGIIGGAFPALFGQGLGASVGGGLGGAAGGLIGGQFGFGLSLVGTALGSQFDEALRKGQLLAAGLDDPIGKFQELRDAALLSSRGLEKQAEALINSGRGAEAAALIQEDLAKRFGDTTQLDGLRNAFDELGRAFSQLSVLTAKFVAGPLNDFLNKLAASFTAQASKQLFDERRATLTPEQRRQVDANASTARAGLNDGSRTLAEAAVIYYQRQLDFIDQIAGKTKVAAEAERDLAAAKLRTARLNQISLDLIKAEAAGNKQRVNELKREQLDLQRINQEKEAGAKAAKATLDQINQDTRQKDLQLTEEAAREERQRWANSIVSVNRIRDIQGQIAIESRRSGLSDIGVGALRTIEQLRSAIRAEQNAQAQLRINPFDSEALNASREAAANTRLAAAKAKQDLLEAFRAAQDSVRTISRSVQDASLQLLQNQAGTGGLNRFLSGQALYNNQQLAFQQLLPQFLQARELAAQDALRSGNSFAAEQFRTLNFSGSTAGVNQAMIDFIQAQRGQERLQQDLLASNVELAKANASLAVVTQALSDSSLKVYETNNRLAGSIDALATKDWSIQVSVAADGTSTAYGDVLNGAVTQ